MKRMLTLGAVSLSLLGALPAQAQEATKVVFKTGLPDNLFSFTPPAGARIQDGNEMLNQMMQKMAQPK